MELAVPRESTTSWPPSETCVADNTAALAHPRIIARRNRRFSNLNDRAPMAEMGLRV